MNAENDAIRNRGKTDEQIKAEKKLPEKQPAKAPAPEKTQEPAKDPEKPETAGDTVTTLLAKTIPELTEIIGQLNAEPDRKTKIAIKPGALKVEIVNLILEATGYKVKAEEPK
jgi:hypothetical protein